MQDLAERFTLIVALLFVVGEELVSSGAVEAALVWQCCRIYATEILVDVVKHSAMAKFNDIRPGIYREFFRCVFRGPCRQERLCRGVAK